jgi:hypothetical protein
VADPQYRRRLQQLTDFLVATLPATWQQASVRVTFPSEVSTRLEVSYRETPQSPEAWADVPTPMMRDFAAAARAVRAELVRAGNPECSGYVFRITSTGKSSLDVEY